MNSNNSLVSIIIPTYKGSGELARAINSLLQQSYDNIEIIVVDDNVPESEDRIKTEKVMLQYVDNSKIIYTKHAKNCNGAAARNTGISIAKGEMIAFLDDDDYYLPDRIKKCVDYLEKNKQVIGVYVGVDVLDQEGNISYTIRPNKELYVKDLLQNESVIGTGSNIFLRSNVIKEVGWFDVSFVRRQDIEFMIRVCHCGHIGFISEKLIIKSMNGTINRPEYKKMKSVIDQFSQKFKTDIDSLGEGKKEYYAMQYRTLFRIALYERNSSRIHEAIELLKKYDKLTAKENILAFIYLCNLRDNKIISTLIFEKNRIKSVLLHRLKGENK